nr:unnamed protein product [Spirometra erinaceieuropaei]
MLLYCIQDELVLIPCRQAGRAAKQQEANRRYKRRCEFQELDDQKKKKKKKKEEEEKKKKKKKKKRSLERQANKTPVPAIAFSSDQEANQSAPTLASTMLYAGSQASIMPDTNVGFCND